MGTPPLTSASALSNAETELVLGARAGAREELEDAGRAVEVVLAGREGSLRSARQALARADEAASRGDASAFAAARATLWAAVLQAGFHEATAAARRGESTAARSWLLVREFRPPTRFSRAAADATLALDRLAQGSLTPAAAAGAVRNDLLDTYEARLRASLDDVREARARRLRRPAARRGGGHGGLLVDRAGRIRGAARRETARAGWTRRWHALSTAAQDGRGSNKALRAADGLLAGFRAAPLSREEQLRRAGQLDRFLRLVPIEYGRGVRDGRVVLDFEIQEAITFRDGAAGAFRDLEPALLRRDAPATRRLAVALSSLGDALAAATRGDAVADPDEVRRHRPIERSRSSRRPSPRNGRRRPRPQTST